MKPRLSDSQLLVTVEVIGQQNKRNRHMKTCVNTSKVIKKVNHENLLLEMVFAITVVDVCEGK